MREMGCGCAKRAAAAPAAWEVMMDYIGKTLRAVVNLPGLECPEMPHWPRAGEEFEWTQCRDLRADIGMLFEIGAVELVARMAPTTPTAPPVALDADDGSVVPPRRRDATRTIQGGGD